jgi:hypothetical protein
LAGATVDITVSQPNAKMIAVTYSGLSTNGTSVPIIQLGDAGGIEATGYLGAAGTPNGAGSSNANYTTGFALVGAANQAANVFHGTLFLHRIQGTNTWVASGTNGLSNAAASTLTGGSKTLSDTLTTIRFTTVGGVDLYDAGTASAQVGQ